MYSESNVSDALIEFAQPDEDDRELLAVYQDHVGSGDGDIDKAREAVIGKYDTKADWAEKWLDETGGLEGVPENLRNYIDFEALDEPARRFADVKAAFPGAEAFAHGRPDRPTVRKGEDNWLIKRDQNIEPFDPLADNIGCALDPSAHWERRG